jgi:hypothetical protein
MGEIAYILTFIHNRRDTGIWQQFYVYTFIEERLKINEQYMNQKETFFWR